MARNSLLCADVPLRNYSLTQSLSDTHSIVAIVAYSIHIPCSASRLYIIVALKSAGSSTLVDMQ